MHYTDKKKRYLFSDYGWQGAPSGWRPPNPGVEYRMYDYKISEYGGPYFFSLSLD